MSKDRKKLLHIHSSVNDKQPTPASLEIGELGVNNAKGNAFISTKNSDGEVVRFSEDGTVIDWIEMKEVFPYEGYVRGADNTISGVTESDLVENKSNIIIKINQVAAPNSEYDEKINGAKDIYGNLVNPLSEDGYRDGAGIAIDMSPYVMIGSNPSFSSITSNCHTTLKGTTEIIGTDGDCGSALNVNVDDVCIDSNDSSTLYGESKTNIGVNCDGTKVSNETTIKGNTIDVIAQGDDSSVSIDSCNEINVTSNNYVLKECTNGVGSVTVSSTTISNSASTIENYACSSINEVTDEFKISECTEGSGSVAIKTTSVDTTACTHNYINTNDFKVTECELGAGTSEINSSNGIALKTDNLVISQNGESGSTNIVSHKEFKVVSNDITLEQSGDGVGKALIKSCDEIKLESKNIILSSNGECGSGQTTVESNDLCLVGEDKINVFGNETNVGLKCDGSEIAANTRIYGKGTLITTKDTEGEVYPSENDIEITAANNIKESADGTITIDAKNSLFEQAALISSDATGTTEGVNYVHADKYVHIKSGDIALYPSLAGEGVNLKLDKDGAFDLFASDNVCVQASNNVTLYGAEETNIGVSCDGSESSSTTTINGGKVIINASSDKLGLTAIGDIDETSEGSINISANDSLCLYGGESASLFGYEVTKVGVNCNGEKSDEIVYYRTPKAGNCELHSNTIDDALDEVYDRSRISLTSTAHTDSSSGSNYSYTEYTLHQDTGTCDVAIPFTVKETIVSMSAETYPASSELLKKYTLWQYVGSERKEIGEINIPKDHILKDATIEHGILDGDVWTDCTATTTPQDCHWYIKLVWNVFDPSTGHPDDKVTYLPADDFIKDINEDNSNTDRGANVDVWYDGKQNWVSADTKLNFATTNGDFKYEKHDGQHWESGTTLTFEEGSFSASTYQPWVTSKTIKVPTSLDHLTEYNGSCYMLNHDICMEDNTIVAKGFYSKSDKNLKENIKAIPYEDYHKVSSINLKSFNFKDDDTKTKTYGVIAQDLQAVGLDNIVHKDENNNLSVDYTSLLILKIADLENTINNLSEEIKNLKGVEDKNK